MLQINEVFTPRSSTVNLKTYVPRLDLELSLLRSIRGSMHSLLFGESGNGKSWMYKKVLEQNHIPYRVANCANASRLRSITAEITGALVAAGTVQKTGYTENKEASIKAVVAEGKLVHQNQYTLQLGEPLEQAFAEFRVKVTGDPAVIVLDNLESIFANSDLMNELADIIILLDDPRYARYRLKFLIVGVPNGVLEYFAKTKNLESVANRLEELPKVSSLTSPMVNTLVKTGFNELLGVSLSSAAIVEISQHIHHVTMGVAQRVQEYCEKLAYKLEDNKSQYDEDLLKQADRDWLILGMRLGYTVVESHLNSKRTTVARRNQVIFSIGRINSHQFDSGKVTDRIREEFPETISETNMGIGSILAELAAGETPLLKKNPKTNEYRVIDPRYIMCIRVMLRIDPISNAVVKLSFGA